MNTLPTLPSASNYRSTSGSQRSEADESVPDLLKRADEEEQPPPPVTNSFTVWKQRYFDADHREIPEGYSAENHAEAVLEFNDKASRKGSRRVLVAKGEKRLPEVPTGVQVESGDSVV